jgi:hypothetical protein
MRGAETNLAGKSTRRNDPQRALTSRLPASLNLILKKIPFFLLDISRSSRYTHGKRPYI